MENELTRVKVLQIQEKEKVTENVDKLAEKEKELGSLKENMQILKEKNVKNAEINEKNKETHTQNSLKLKKYEERLEEMKSQRAETIIKFKIWF